MWTLKASAIQGGPKIVSHYNKSHEIEIRFFRQVKVSHT